MIARLCLSDLHLGDSRSVLSHPEIATKVAEDLRLISGGEVGTLILNGDVWEECVPDDMSLESGLSRSGLEASRAFFGQLFTKIVVHEVVVLPGNHDLCLWDWYMRSEGSSVFVPYTGIAIPAVDWPWRDLFAGRGGDLRLAYPLYWDKSVGDDFPMLAFTHGHLLDPLVLGRDPEAEYVALSALGCRRPTVSPDVSGIESAMTLARLIHDFTLALWKRYSPRDFAFSNYVMRRLLHPQSCVFQGGWLKDDGFYDLDLFHYDMDEPPAGQGYVNQAPWFLELMLLDPGLPSPVGTLGRGPMGPTFTKPSCLVYGHDHLAARKTVIAAGVPFTVVGSAGWTSEFDGHLPHCHVLAWSRAEDVVPKSYFLRARSASGGLW